MNDGSTLDDRILRLTDYPIIILLKDHLELQVLVARKLAFGF